MLVITRREGEEVVVGDPRKPIGAIRIASIKNDKVRLAFQFPSGIHIHRREIADQMLTTDQPPPAPHHKADTTLVITRREGEEVVVGDPRQPLGVVRVASIKGERVRIAFDFPREIETTRREVADQIVGELPVIERVKAGPINTGVAASDELVEFLEPEIMRRALHIYIDPGAADEDLIAELLIALSDMHRAAGGLGFEFRRQSNHAVIPSEVPV